MPDESQEEIPNIFKQEIKKEFNYWIIISYVFMFLFGFAIGKITLPSEEKPLGQICKEICSDGIKAFNESLGSCECREKQE